MIYVACSLLSTNVECKDVTPFRDNPIGHEGSRYPGKKLIKIVKQSARECDNFPRLLIGLAVIRLV